MTGLIGKRSVLFRVLVSLSAIFLCLWSILTSVCFQFPSEVNVILGTSNSKVVDDGTEKQINYERGYTDEALEAAVHDACVEAAQEGVTIIKNENGALPMDKTKTVSFFGIGSGNIIYSGASSGYGFASGADLVGALKANGMKVNDTIFEWYKAQGPEEYMKLTGEMGNKTNDNLTISEVPVEKVKSEGAAALATVKSTDIGVLVVARRGGEGAIDLKSSDGADYDNYLDLNAEERDTLKLMKETTSVQIVLLNCNNAFALDFIDDKELGVDAVVWMPYMSDGIQGVADVLTGKVNPSGHLVDTWARSSTSAPSFQNLYQNQWTNYQEVMKLTGSSATGAQDYSSFHNDAFLIYQEGIYVGYKYYETRYEDAVLGQGNADGSAGASYGSSWDYSNEVVRPFGYGESYTTFSEELVSVSEEKTDSFGEKYFEITVKVTNTGSVAGKDTVQIYFQQPYLTGGIEKASICLGGFEKTEILEPGKSQEVTVSVLKRDMASYDYQNAGTYVFEAGDYYFAAGENVHDALNNILAAKGTGVLGNRELAVRKFLDADDSFSLSEQGIEVKNRLSDADINHYGYNISYLSRADWQGTFPETMKLEASTEVIEDLKNLNYTPKTDESEKIKEKYPNYLAGNGGTLSLAMMKGESFDSPLWYDIVDQLSLEELINLNTNGYPGTAAVVSINKPEGNALNGPTGHIEGGYTFPCKVLYAATWNVKCLEKLGELIAEDGLRLGRTGIMGPGVNIHRTPYSGRNFEYYSEDGIFNGIMVWHEIAAYLNIGGEVYVKHFAFNDQETHRFGVSVFGNEQAFREIYLKPFEYAFNRANCNFVMTSYNRVGCTWTGASHPLLQEILRGEWGYKGIITTDNITMALGYADPIAAKFAGIDNWRNRQNQVIGQMYNKYGGTDFKLYEAMRNSAKYSLYTSANSVVMKGISANASVVLVTPWWIPTVITVNIVLALMFLSLAAALVIKERKLNKEGKYNE